MRVLVLHALRPTSRTTTIDHILAFRRHLPDDEVVHLHFQQPIPPQLRDVTFDLVVVNYDFLNYRFAPLWPYVRNRHRFLRERARRLVAVTQDDFFAHRLLDDWIVDWDVDHVFTPLDTDLHVLYPRSINGRPFTTVQTAYVEPENLRRFADFVVPFAERSRDLGQRVRHMPANLGRLGREKSFQSVRFAELARAAGVTVDVSTDVAQAFVGDDWYRFLGDCRFTIGMKGGASLPDPDGSLRIATEAYERRHPDASFDEIAEHCFPPGADRWRFTATNPRLFDAALMRTCQILAPDDYLGGVLEPWKHYLPLQSDMSNADEVLNAMRDLELCESIAARCYDEVVGSPTFHYESYVDTVVAGARELPAAAPAGDLDAVRRGLRRTEAFIRRDSAELHDAVQLWLHDARMRGRLAEAQRLVDQLLVGSSAPVHWQDALANVASLPSRGPLLAGDAQAATRSVLAHCLAAGLSPELLWHVRSARAGATDSRLVWPWRPARHFDGPQARV